MSRTFCRENKDKKVEQQGRETEITWEGAWGGKKSVHLYQKYFRLLKLLGADKKKGWGKKVGHLKYSSQHCTLKKCCTAWAANAGITDAAFI